MVTNIPAKILKKLKNLKKILAPFLHRVFLHLTADAAGDVLQKKTRAPYRHIAEPNLQFPLIAIRVQNDNLTAIIRRLQISLVLRLKRFYPEKQGHWITGLTNTPPQQNRFAKTRPCEFRKAYMNSTRQPSFIWHINLKATGLSDDDSLLTTYTS